MKIESLNTWGGRVYEPLINHLEEQSKEIDIFCLQEIYSSPSPQIYSRGTENQQPGELTNKQPARARLFEDISQVLKGFKGFYYYSQSGYDGVGKTNVEIYFGQAMFLKDNIKIDQEGEVFVYLKRDARGEGEDASKQGRNLQYATFQLHNKKVTIANFHGLWHPAGKIDLPERIEQSVKIKSFLANIKGEKILCGDFNLLPTTNSLAILGKGMNNLIRDFHIQNTRSRFYTRNDKFADYILTTPGIKILDFKVSNVQVSDHLPLVLEFE